MRCGISPSVVGILLTLLHFSSGLLQSREQCSAVSRTYTGLGYPAIDVPRRARSGSELGICSHGYTCCSPEMEVNLDRHSRQEFAQRLANTTEFSRTSLITATAKFNEFFLNLLEMGQRELDVMFSTAYGLQYKQNQDVFNQLFANFQRYYKGGDISLNDAMNTFFKDVFLRMFQMQSPEYEFNSAYLRCVEVKMDELKPFGDTPSILKKNIRQAFVAARTFVQGLAIGRNVALKMAQVEPTESCSEAYTKQSFCGVCQGLTQLKPCYEYCENVMRGCLAHHYELNSSWVNYIDAMNGLAERLEGGGSFNIEVVITPLKDMISTAIMEYHGSSKAISDQIFDRQACGMPPPVGRSSRTKRRSRTRDRQRSSAAPHSMGKQIKLNDLVSDIKSKMRQIRAVWSELPTSMCSGRQTAAKDSSQCWNGDNEARYSKAEVGYGLRANQNNPEVRLTNRNTNPLITEQMAELNKATRHLNNAKLGINVDWLDFDVSLTENQPQTTSGGEAGGVTTASTGIPMRGRTDNADIKLSGGSSDDVVEISSGSGDLNTEEVTVDQDTEGGDDRDDGYLVNTGSNRDPGSGWDSNIVVIAPIVKKPRPNGNRQSGDREKKPESSGSDEVEGSGRYIDTEDNKPIAIPIKPSKNKPDYQNGRHATGNDLYPEGSGDTRFTFTDDEDEIIKLSGGGAKYPSETRVINVNDYERRVDIATVETTTPKSSANSRFIIQGSYSSLILLSAVTLMHIIHNAVS